MTRSSTPEITFSAGKEEYSAERVLRPGYFVHPNEMCKLSILPKFSPAFSLFCSKLGIKVIKLLNPSQAKQGLANNFFLTQGYIVFLTSTPFILVIFVVSVQL